MRDRVRNISAGTDLVSGHAPAPGVPSRIEHVLDMARDAFVETDADGVLTEWNRQSEVLFGWSRDEVLGRPVTDSSSRRATAPPCSTGSTRRAVTAAPWADAAPAARPAAP